MAYYDRVPPITTGKKVRSYGIETCCKIIEYNSNDPVNYKRTFAFGKVMKQWCLTASCRTTAPDHIYIDRIEAHDTCFIDKKPIEESTAKLVRLALYVMRSIVPSIDRFTLKDDSYIYCNGKDYGPKISLAYEYILKYNQTWYQHKFGAVLDGFLSQTTDIASVQSEDNVEHIIVPIMSVDTLFRVVTRSLMSYYLKSLAILDMQCDQYDDIITDCPYIKKYEAEYRAASSPRDFMHKVRGQFTKEEYCMNVKNWLHSYMEFLGIMVYYDAWYIPSIAVETPKDVQISDMPAQNVAKIFGGGAGVGATLRNRWRGGGHHATRKNQKGCGIIPFRGESVGRSIPWDEL